MTRAPFADLAAAQAVADEIRAAPGWVVVRVDGERPGGPPRTSTAHNRVLMRDVPDASHVRRLPPVVVAYTPDRRTVTIGSRERWLALLEGSVAP